MFRSHIVVIFREVLLFYIYKWNYPDVLRNISFREHIAEEIIDFTRDAAFRELRNFAE